MNFVTKTSRDKIQITQHLSAYAATSRKWSTTPECDLASCPHPNATGTSTLLEISHWVNFSQYPMTLMAQYERFLFVDMQDVKRGSIKSQPVTSCLISFSLNYSPSFYLIICVLPVTIFLSSAFSPLNAFSHWWKLIFHASYWLSGSGSKWLPIFFASAPLSAFHIPFTNETLCLLTSSLSSHYIKMFQPFSFVSTNLFRPIVMCKASSFPDVILPLNEPETAMLLQMQLWPAAVASKKHYGTRSVTISELITSSPRFFHSDGLHDFTRLGIEGQSIRDRCHFILPLFLCTRVLNKQLQIPFIYNSFSVPYARELQDCLWVSFGPINLLLVPGVRTALPRVKSDSLKYI
jgi:hypothetical protein